MQGWLKLHRKLMTSEIFRNEKSLKVFIYCLMKATHSDHKQLVGLREVHLKPGQFIFGRSKAASELDMKESTVWKHMKLLEKLNSISLNSNNKFTVVTIDNWGDYQSLDEDSEQQNNNKITTKEQQNNTNKNVKNVKNDKEDINTSSRKSKTYDKESVPFQLASRLFRNIKSNNPTFKEPNLQKWADDIRLMIDRDERTEKQIAYLMDWCQQDSFWKGNILSPAKLRKQFDQLVIKVKSESQDKNKSVQSFSLSRPSHWKEPEPLTEEQYQRMKEIEAELPY